MPMRRLLLAFGLLMGIAIQAMAEERIESFVSDVTVNTDASLSVRETIAVTAEGNVIKRGIFRDIPTIYQDRHGQRVVVGLDVIAVRRDGRDEPFSIEGQSNGKRIRIGDADVFIDHGLHTYEITYRTTRQLGFFDGFDELYWNVTGNGWPFAIDSAVVIVRLPPGARIQQHSEYTGYQGSQANDSEVLAASGSEYRARTTRPLAPNEGFTIAVAWQKGIVAPPSDSEKLGWWLSDNLGLFALLATLASSGVFYYYAWNKVGRDPPKGTIVPLFKPPAGLGAGGARFVWKQGFDDRAFAAALIGLAVKGRVRIIDDSGGHAIEKNADGGEALTSAERAIYDTLPAGTTQLKQGNHVKVRSIRAALVEALEKEYEGSVFLRNIGWFWAGAAISVAGLVISALLLPPEDGMTAIFAVLWSGIWWGVILSVAWRSLKGARHSRGILNKIGSVMSLLFLIPFMAGGLIAPAALLFTGGSPRLYMVVGTAVVLGLMNMVFFQLLRAPTVPGRRLLDQLEGFRMYLATAEEERLKMFHPPEKTPELFERYLPFALALDCENEWNQKFTAVLAAAAVAGAAAPAWYSSRNWNPGDMGGFTDSLGSSLASSISSAATAPGRSSGSSGGGSSGGGGGGGGGGGW